MRKISSSSNMDHVHEGRLTILSPDERRSDAAAAEANTSFTPTQPHLPMPTTSANTADGKDVIVHINEGNPNTTLWRGSSYDFWKDAEQSPNDDAAGFNFQPPSSAHAARPIEHPPSRVIGQCLHKQKPSGDYSLDMDLAMDELREDRNSPSVDDSPLFLEASREPKVSFYPSAPNVSEQPDDSVRRRYRDAVGDEEFQRQQRQEPRGSLSINDSADSDDGAEVIRCSSSATVDRNISFQKRSSLLGAKTRSRLMDPPEEPTRKSCRVPKSGQMKSGFLGRMDDEEDDPFKEEDLPEKYTKVTFNALTLIQWVSLILIVAFLMCSLAIPYLRKMDLWELPLWKWDVMILILICGRLVSGWGIRIVVFFIERNFFLRKRVLYFVYGVRKPVQNCLWLGLVLIAWHFLFDKKVERETHNNVVLMYITKILICFLVGTLIWLVKTLIVKVLASSFHVSTYFDRIQESLFNQFVIEALSGPPLVELQKSEEEEERIVDEFEKMQRAGINIPADLRASAFQSAKSGRLIGSGRVQKSPQFRSGKISQSLSQKREEGITIDYLHKLNPKNVSAWNMKRLIKIIRNGSITTLDEQAVDSLQDDESAINIKSENEAKAAAKKIFQNVARCGSRYIYLEDLLRFMHEDEALKTMNLFEGASDSGKITRSSLKNWVVNAFRERRALALTLNDTKTAVNKLHRMTNFIVAIAILVIWLLMLGIATSQFLVFMSSQLILVAFIFGNTCRTVFEAIIFLFVIHPFDVGDRCEIDGVQMVVEEMNILTTVFLRYDNMRLIFPNIILATKPINNFYRSPDMGDAVEFCVHIATPADKIAAMKRRIISYIDNKKDHWYPSPMFVFKDVEEMNRLRLAVWLCHKMNHQDIGEKWLRRAQLVEELSKILRELDIQYRLLPLDINVLHVPPVTSERVPPSWMATRG